jgi:hypothetical protein
MWSLPRIRIRTRMRARIGEPRQPAGAVRSDARRWQGWSLRLPHRLQRLRGSVVQRLPGPAALARAAAGRPREAVARPPLREQPAAAPGGDRTCALACSGEDAQTHAGGSVTRAWCGLGEQRGTSAASPSCAPVEQRRATELMSLQATAGLPLPALRVPLSRHRSAPEPHGGRKGTAGALRPGELEPQASPL